jgi:hypothetical protein
MVTLWWLAVWNVVMCARECDLHSNSATMARVLSENLEGNHAQLLTVSLDNDDSKPDDLTAATAEARPRHP